MRDALLASMLFASSLALAGQRRPYPDNRFFSITGCTLPKGPAGAPPAREVFAPVFSAADQTVAAVAWSADEKRVLMWSHDAFMIADVAGGRSENEFRAELLQATNARHSFCHNGAGFSPDGDWLHASDLVGVTIIERTTGRIAEFVNRPFLVSNGIEALSAKFFRAVALSPRAKLLAHRDTKAFERVELIEPHSEATVGWLEFSGPVQRLAFDKTGRSLVVLYALPKAIFVVERVDVATKRSLWRKELDSRGDYGALDLSFHPERDEVFVRFDKKAFVLDGASGAEQSSFAVAGGGWLSPSGTRIFFPSRGGLRLIDSASGERVPPSAGRWFDDGFSHLAVGADGAIAFAALGKNAGLGYLPAGAATPVRIPFDGPEHAKLVKSAAGLIALSPDGKRLYAFDRARGLHVFGLDREKPVELASARIEASSLYELVVSPDGKEFAVELESTQAPGRLVSIRSAATLEETRRIEGSHPRWAAAASRFTYSIYKPERAVVVEDSGTRHELARIPDAMAPALSPDGLTVVAWRGVMGELQVVRFAATDGRVLAEGPRHKFGNLAFTSRSGRVSVFPPPGQQPHVVSPDAPAPVVLVNNKWGQLFDISVDDRQLFAAGPDGSLAMWPIPTVLALEKKTATWEDFARSYYGHARFVPSLRRTMPESVPPAELKPPKLEELLGRYAKTHRSLALQLVGAADLFAKIASRKPSCDGGVIAESVVVYARLAEGIHLAERSLASLEPQVALPVKRAAVEAAQLLTQVRALKQCSALGAPPQLKRLDAIGTALGEAFEAASRL